MAGAIDRRDGQRVDGVGEQQAFQLLENAPGIFYGLTYLVMFVIGLNIAGLALYLAAQRRRAAAVVAMLVICVGGTARAQEKANDATKCDSIVFAARVDSVSVAIYVTTTRVDGLIFPEQSRAISTVVATGFTPPRPFRLSVFSGPVRMSTFRRVGGDTITELRPPIVTGVYRFWSSPKRPVAKPVTARASLVPGFDSAALAALASASTAKDLVVPPVGEDSMLVEVRFSTDSLAGSLRMLSATFPRMPVIDASPKRDNPRPVFPEVEKVDSSSRGDVVMQFVVDRAGLPALETVEVVRGSSLAFVRAVLAVLPNQRFSPARINGCTVAQVVSYPFVFVVPDSTKVPPRH